MNWYLFNLIVLISSILVTGLCSVVLCFQSPSKEQKYTSYTIGAFFLYLMGNLAFYSGFEEQIMIYGLKLEIFSGFLIYFMVYEFFQRVYNIRVPRIISVLLGLWSLFLLLVCDSFSRDLSIPFCHYFYQNYYLAVDAAGKSFFVTQPGWAHTAYFITIIAYVFITLIMFCSRFVRTNRAERIDSILFFFCMFIPQVVLIIAIARGISDKKFPGFAVSGTIATIIMTVLICKEHFTNLLDHAHNLVVNSLSDPMFITDKDYFIQEINAEAKKLYPQFLNVNLNRHNRVRLPQDVQNIVTPPAILSQTDKENLRVRLNSKVYSVKVTSIDRYGHPFGYIVSLKDMTEQNYKFEQTERTNDKLRQELQCTQDKIFTMREKIVSACIQFILSKNSDIGNHMRRTSNYVLILCRQMQYMGIYNEFLNDYFIETLVQVAPLHDIGKVMIPDELLESNRILDNSELRLMKSHVTEGARIIDRIMINNKEDLYYRLAREVTLYHHEWWDGCGYESGLREQDIPLSARIIAVVDLFDSLTYKYRNDYDGYNKAFDIIVSAKGSQFDPMIIDAFIKAKSKLKDAFKNIIHSSSSLQSEEE